VTTQLFSDTSNPPFVATFHHWSYRETHDILHFAYRSECGDPYPVRNHLLLQDKIVEIRAVERRAR